MGNKVLDSLLLEKKEKIKGRLYHYTQIHMAYNSNHIEGSKLTEDQTRLIFETASFFSDGKEAVNTNDIVETINHFDLFDYMLDTIDQPLSQELIKQFHSIMKRGTSGSRLSWFKVGDYKALSNEVGGRETASPENVSEKMEVLLNKYQEAMTLEDIVEFHVAFEKIHPFQDGNGRVGRIIMFRQCLQNNIVPFIMEDSYKAFYYRGLQEFSNERGYLLDTCRMMQDIYSAKLKQLRVV